MVQPWWWWQSPCYFGGGGFVLGSDWLHCTTAQLMYLTNVQRLALGLEGTPDAPQSVVAAAVTKTGHKGYVAPDYVVPSLPGPKGGVGKA